eukprot:1384375-Amorphochlora_amoeboformis.AAC.1
MDLRHGEVFQQATTINNQSTGDILSAPKSNAMDTAPTSYWCTIRLSTHTHPIIASPCIQILKHLNIV